jgi:predicted metalloprotease with PDZ domain
MKYFKIVFTLAGILSLQLVFSQSKSNAYHYTVDLTQVVDDKVYVELSTPTISSSEITFYMPKIIPGTYAIADYGRFVTQLAAFDKKGNALPVEKVDENSWKIKNATKLKKLSYWVDDSTDGSIPGPSLYPMAATNIEAGKNFVINTSGFFGYFENLKNTSFSLTFVRDKNFYGTTGLVPAKSGEPVSKLSKEKPANATEKRFDLFTLENYDRLIDSPIMYSLPDTAIIRVGKTQVLIGAYSPTGKINAKEISNSIREVLMAQQKYLGGTLPVNKYAFIFYFTTEPIQSYGALEHSYSSFYYMPETTITEMQQQLRDFAAHEFFHIVTPLTIHSEEIHNFDFNNPKMSRHLWLYEGVTEYFAGHVQVKYGLISPEQYLAVLRQKLFIASNFLDDVPFTDISLYTLDKYKDQYYNVYQKGALIGLCLDIKLLQLSNGKYGLRNLIADLSKKYGEKTAFKDAELFDEITRLTFPEIGIFLNRYVGGPEPLPLQEVLEAVGIRYFPELGTLELSLGLESNSVSVTMVDDKPHLTIANLSLLNQQGLSIGFLVGDVLLKINGDVIPGLGAEFRQFVQQKQSELKEGGTLSYTVLRTNEAGEKKQVELSAPVRKIERKQRFILSLQEDATAEQLELRKAWLSGN